MLKQYLQDFTRLAHQQGISHLEYYLEESASRSVQVFQGELDQLEQSKQQLLFIEGQVEGFYGGVFVENFQPELFAEHIQTIRKSALARRQSAMERTIPQLPEETETLPKWMDLTELVERLAAAERAAYAADGRVSQVQHCGCSETIKTVTLINEAGQSVSDSSATGHFYIGLNARQGDAVQLGGRGEPFLLGQYPDMEKLARQAAEDAVTKLDAASYPTGTSPVVLSSGVVCELLDAFLPAFFAKNVQTHMSVLEGRMGQQVAGKAVTLTEEPAMADGIRCRRFDDEGVPTVRKTLLDGGRLSSLLYDRRSAQQDGAAPGGNGFKTGFAEEVSTGYTNVVLQCGEKSRDQQLRDMGSGLLITGVSGVFAGANPSTANFSLIAKGYRVENGQRGRGVSQITIAGNFFEMLETVCSVGSEASWMGAANGCVCAPSLHVGRLAVSGEE